MEPDEAPLNVEVPRSILAALARAKKFGPNYKVITAAALYMALRGPREDLFRMIEDYTGWLETGAGEIEPAVKPKAEGIANGVARKHAPPPAIKPRKTG